MYEGVSMVIGSICTEKGGVGKTSILFHTAWELSERNSVLMIDTESQRSNLTSYAGIRKDRNLVTIRNVLESDSAFGAVREIRPGLDMIPADESCISLQAQNCIQPMKKLIRKLQGRYDYIFIDVGASGYLHAAVLAVSDYIIIPVTLEYGSLGAIQGIAQSVQEIRQINPRLQILGILVNRYSVRSTLRKEILQTMGRLADQLQTRLFDTRIHESVLFDAGITAHKGISDYAPKSKPADDIRALSAELERLTHMSKKGE